MATISPAELARMRVVYEVPGMDQVEVRRNLVYHHAEGTPMAMDVYLPAARPAPAAPATSATSATPAASAASATVGIGGHRPAAVLLIHGGPVPVAAYPKVKDMGVFVSWGELLAASGLAAVTFNHLHHGWHDLDESAGHVAAAIAYLRAEADGLRLDPDRLCLWVFSGGGPQLAPALAAPDPAGGGATAGTEPAPSPGAGAEATPHGDGAAGTRAGTPAPEAQPRR